MKGNKQSGLRRSQHSISYLLSSADESDPLLRARSQHLKELYPRRLLEDIYNYILPMGNKAAEIHWQPLTSPPDVEIEKLLASALDRGDHHRDLAAASDRFFRECAHMILAYEEAPYEIVYFWQPKDEDSQHDVLVNPMCKLFGFKRPSALAEAEELLLGY